MSLLDEAQSLVRRAGSPCGVTLLAEGLSPEEQAELSEALESRVSAQALADALKGRGYQIQGQTINRHRRGDCTCR